MIADAAEGEAGAFIRANLRLAPIPSLPHLRLYMAHSGSRLSRIGTTPYWAYPWAGGMALALHLAARPEIVAGRRVLDYGAGSGLVAIAAARAGARTALAVDTDPLARAAIALNAEANGVFVGNADGASAQLDTVVDIVLAGDVFYDRAVAAHSIETFERHRAAGREVLVGDPGRADLPLARLRVLAEYPVRDFGAGVSDTAGAGRVFAFDPD